MSAATPSITIEALTAKLAEMQAAAHVGVAEALPPIRAVFGSIARRAVHEWFAQAPPQTLLIDVARRAIAWEEGDQEAKREQDEAPTQTPLPGPGAWVGGEVFWIGRACWPYAPALCQAGNALLERSVFVDIPRRQQGMRVWAIDLALRSPAVIAVVADGRDLDTAQSRRLQLAAEAGSSVALLWRQPHEMRAISVAHYRWRVTPQPTARAHPCWQVACIRSKDAGAWRHEWNQKSCLVEHHYAKGLVAVSADVVGRPRSAEVGEAEYQLG